MYDDSNKPQKSLTQNGFDVVIKEINDVERILAGVSVRLRRLRTLINSVRKDK